MYNLIRFIRCRYLRELVPRRAPQCRYIVIIIIIVMHLFFFYCFLLKFVFCFLRHTYIVITFTSLYKKAGRYINVVIGIQSFFLYIYATRVYVIIYCLLRNWLVVGIFNTDLLQNQIEKPHKKRK